MSWFGLDKLILGYSLDEQQAISDNLDKKLSDLNDAALANGTYDAATYAQAQANVAASHQDVTGEVDAAFAQGLRDGANAEINFATQTVPNAINGTLSATVGAIFRAIPFSVWLIAAVALFFWMGGLTMLKGRLAK